MSHSIKRNDFPRGERMPRRKREAAPDLFSLKCGECGRPMVHTLSGYLSCPHGHGRLQLDLTQAPMEEADTFLCFPDTLENAG